MISFDKAREKAEFFEVEIYSTDQIVEGFFTCARVDRNTVPEGWYAYDLREGNDGDFCTIENAVTVNHGGTFLTEEKLDLGPSGCLELEEDFDYSF